VAITATVRQVQNTGFSSSQTLASSSHSWTAGNRILVFGAALRDFHGSGLGAAFVVSGGSLSWTEVDATTIFNNLAPDDDVSGQCKLWISPVLLSTSSFAITIDANNAGSQSFYYGMQLVELSADGEITVVQSDDAGGAGSSPSIVFGASPADHQLAWWMLSHDTANCTMPAAPANFAKVTGGVSTARGQATQLLESTTNTSTTIAYTPSSTNSFQFHAVGVELEEADSGQTVNVAQVSETDTVLAVTPLAGGAVSEVALTSETDTALPVTASPGPVSVVIDLATETDSVLGVSAVAGAAALILDQAVETDAALGLAAVGGAVTVGVDLVTESDSALPTVAAAGGVTVEVGLVTETDSALAATAGTSGAVAVDQAVETDTLLAVTPSAGPVIVALDVVAETASVPAVTPSTGPAVVAIGIASEVSSALVISPVGDVVSAAVGNRAGPAELRHHVGTVAERHTAIVTP